MMTVLKAHNIELLLSWTTSFVCVPCSLLSASENPLYELIEDFLQPSSPTPEPIASTPPCEWPAVNWAWLENPKVLPLPSGSESL